ncbi:nucleotidyltransferase family protein [Candidatus Poribacteria bacterium]|nr:nucleotidyltransferase family protein [Candidatus Poribacteria bacterium]
MNRHGLEIDKDALAAFCRRNHIRKLSLFGSILREDFTPESDVDVLVEFEAGRAPGFAFFTLHEELEAIIGRKVDLNTPECLSRYFIKEVLRDAETIYVAA